MVIMWMIIKHFLQHLRNKGCHVITNPQSFTSIPSVECIHFVLFSLFGGIIKFIRLTVLLMVLLKNFRFGLSVDNIITQ